jgi:Arabidopsis protein of unknown function
VMPNFSHPISLPMKPRRRDRTACHVRSASLPCQSHPLVVNLEDKITDVRSWTAGADVSIATIETGLSQTELLVSAVNDFLNLSDAKTMLQHASASTDILLENFLFLIDLYGSFLSDIVALKQHQCEVQSALRRHDSTMLASCLKTQKRIEKELSRLMVSLRPATKCLSLIDGTDSPKTEILGALRDAISAMLAASVVAFNRAVAVSAAASTSATSSALPTIRPFKKNIPKREIEMLVYVKYGELNKCVRIVENGSEKVLKALVNCRVTLLNIHSDSI